MATKRKKKASNKKGGDRAAAGRRPLWLRITGWGLLAGTLGALLGGATLVGAFLYYGRDPDLPRISSAHEYRPKTVSRIYDRNGVLIAELAAERRTVVAFDRIPKVLVNAVVSAEDADFFKHAGLDYTGMLRAFFANLRSGRFAQGGSTITQQTVKTFFLSPERTIRRKMQEVILARRLESELSKDEILHLYLNQIYFGHGRYGVQEASRFFFGKDVDKITVAEAAMLAGLPQSPERLSPLKHPKRAKRRQLYVLRMMAAHGHISPEVARAVGRRPIRVVRNVRAQLGAAPEVTTLVKRHLIAAFGAKKLPTLGTAVHTTVDIELQRAAREALHWGLRAIDKRNGYRGRRKHLEGKRLEKLRKRLARDQKQLKAGQLVLGVVLAVDDKAEQLRVDLGAKEVTVEVDDERYNPQSHVASKRFAPGDLIRVRVGVRGYRFDAGPQAAMVVLEPKSGDVLAMVGGYDFVPGGFNRATRALRQPGSAFKPFVYAAALDSGRYTPATVVDDAPVVFDGWEPHNFDGKYRGPIRLREALAHSINTVAARLISDVGVDKVRALAQASGITSELGRDLSLALGSSAVSVIDLATAYATIANGGTSVRTRLITRIGAEPVKGPPLEERPQAMRPAVAFVLTSMMQSVVQEGTARRARRLMRPLAGKTGTTNDLRDAWFAGFAPQLVAVVWVGYDIPEPIGRHETGGRAALPIWVRFMREALKGKPKQPFSQPPGVVVQRIDPQSGLLAAEGSSEGLEEVFIRGTEPTEYARAPDEVDPSTILMNPAVQ